MVLCYLVDGLTLKCKNFSVVKFRYSEMNRDIVSLEIIVGHNSGNFVVLSCFMYIIVHISIFLSLQIGLLANG